MWDLIKQVFDGKEHPWRTFAIVIVLLVIGAFSAWKSIPDSGRSTLLRPMLDSYAARHAAPIAQEAGDSANSLERTVRLPTTMVTLQYFSRSSDSSLSRPFLNLINQRGLSVETRQANRSERSNAVWCGSAVTSGECVLVALRMIQAGFTVKQISRLPDADAARSHIIQVGYNDNLGSADPYSITRLMGLSRTQVPVDRTPP
jgi:hypothetical protein